MRSLFANELCNFSANSWVEDQRDANELGFCAGGVVWVDPYDAERKAAQDLTCLRALPGERALESVQAGGSSQGDHPHRR